MNNTPKMLPYSDNRYCVIVPVYNNVASISNVLCEINKYWRDVIVVDDGSTDGTSTVLQESAHLFDVVSYTPNRGKGHALLVGFKKAKDSGYTHVITIDADGQHYPKYIPLFIAESRRSPSAIISGVRFFESKKINAGSLFANKFSNFWFWLQTACHLSDTQCGFRLYPLNHLHWLKFVTSRYESELEMLVFAVWHGVEIKPLPIDVYYPNPGDRVSHFRPFYDFARISILNTILCFLAVVYGYPKKCLSLLNTHI